MIHDCISLLKPIAVPPSFSLTLKLRTTVNRLYFKTNEQLFNKGKFICFLLTAPYLRHHRLIIFKNKTA